MPHEWLWPGGLNGFWIKDLGLWNGSNLNGIDPLLSQHV
jgi:hypothetical protein